MKVLLDECVDQRLGVEIVGHEVRTVPEMGWANFQNGQPLTLAQEDFDAFVTVDGNLPYQQNLPKYDIAVVVLRAKSSRLVDLQPLVPKLLEFLPTAPSPEATFVSL